MRSLFGWKTPSVARRVSRCSPHLEVLEDRRLLTFFAVVQAPEVDVQEMASADLFYPRDPGPVVPISLACDANPMGMGLHNGYFNVVGSKSSGFVIASLPESGQQMGDPIQVSFHFSYTALLENFYDYPPLEDSAISYSGNVRGGDTDQDLFKGKISTEFTPGDKISDKGDVSIAMNVGDQIQISLLADGEAHAAEPHFRDRVAFFSDFSIQDQSGNGPATPRSNRLELAGFPAMVPEAIHGQSRAFLDLPLWQESNYQENGGTAANSPGNIHSLDLICMALGEVSENSTPGSLLVPFVRNQSRGMVQGEWVSEITPDGQFYPTD
jgi:hypothetical protein